MTATSHSRSPHGSTLDTTSVDVTPDIGAGPTATMQIRITSGGQQRTIAFTAVSAGFTVTSISPTSATRGRATELTLRGTGFRSDFTADLIDSGVPFAIPARTFVDSTTVRVTPLIGSGPGRVMQIRINSGGQQRSIDLQTLTGGPAITSVEPSVPTASSLDQDVIVRGRDFLSNLVIAVTFPGGGQRVLQGSQQIMDVLGSSLKMRILLRDAGPYKIKITNPDSAESEWFGFTVQPGASHPIVTRADPSTPLASPDDQSLKLIGSGFTSDLKINVTFPGGGHGLLQGPAQILSVSASGDSVDTKITLKDPGHYGLEIVNSDGARSPTFDLMVGGGTPALWVDHGTSSQKAAGQWFAFDGTGYTPDTDIARLVRGPDGVERTDTPVRSDSQGRVIWTTATTCKSGLGSYTLHLQDPPTGRVSSSVTYTIVANDACTKPTAGPVGAGTSLLGTAPNTGKNGDPVNTATGNYLYSRLDLRMGGRSLPCAFVRFYNSLDALTNGPLGYGWTHSYNIAVTEQSDGSVTVRWGDGRVDIFDGSGGSYTPRFGGVFDSLARTTDGFTVRRKNQEVFSFRLDGKLTQIADRNGNAVTLTYDGSGYLIQVRDPFGRLVAFDNDVLGRLTRITDPIGRVVSFTYDADGNLATASPSGSAWQYIYDSRHRMTSAVDPRGTIFLQNEFDASGRVAAQTDGNGNRYVFSYDPVTGVTTVTDPLGNEAIDVHDEGGLILARQAQVISQMESRTTTCATGRATSIRTASAHRTGYDAVGNLTGLLTPTDSTIQVTYDASNNPLTFTDLAGNVTRFTYDAKGNLLSQTDPSGNIRRFTYNGRGDVISMTDEVGRTTTFTYDGDGNLESETDALQQRRNFAYDGAGRLIAATDPVGAVTRYGYDNEDHLLHVSDPMGRSFAFVYDANGNRTRMRDQLVNVWSYTYDANNLLTSETDPDGHVTTHGYDKVNNRVTTRTPRDQELRFTYDREGRLLSEADGLGHVTRYSYDRTGNRVSVSEPDESPVTFVYDELNRLVQTSDPLGNETTSAYDVRGLPREHRDQGGRTTLFEYDVLNRPKSVTNPVGGRVSYGYDAVGNRTSVTDARSSVWRYQYDDANRLVAETDPLDRIRSFVYDAAGHVLERRDPSGSVLTYGYDPTGRVTRITPSAGAKVSFEYRRARAPHVDDRWHR